MRGSKVIGGASILTALIAGAFVAKGTGSGSLGLATTLGLLSIGLAFLGTAYRFYEILHESLNPSDPRQVNPPRG